MSNCQTTFQGKTIPSGDFEYQIASNQIDLSPTSKSDLDAMSILTLDLSTIPLLSPDKINSAQQEEMINWLTGEVINYSLNNAVKGGDDKELINTAFNQALELLKDGSLEAEQEGILVLKERIGNILEVYDKLKEIVQIRVNNFGIDFEAENTTPEDDTENHAEDKSLRINPYTKIGQEIKKQLFTIYDIKTLQENGSYTEDDMKRTWFGFPAYKSINSVLPTLLSHSKNLAAEYDVIKAELLKSKDANKWFVPLFDKLSEADGQVRNQFARWASKTQINLKYLQFNTKTNEFQFNNSNSGRQVDIITNKWKNNLIQTNLFVVNSTTNEYELDKTKAEAITENFKVFSDKYKMLKENYPDELFMELSNILKDIGVDISPKEIKRMQKFLDTQGMKWLNTPKANFSTFFIADKGAVYYMIQKLSSPDKEASNSFDKYNPLSDNTGVRALTLLYSYYQDIATNDSYKNSNNDTIYAYSPKKYASDQLQRLLDTTYLGKLMETQFSSNSTWGKALMSADPDTKARFLEVFSLDYYDGAKGKGSGLNTPFDQLSASEREKFLLTCFQNQGRSLDKAGKYRYGSTSYLTMSDKKTLISVQHILEDVDIDLETNELGPKSIDLLYEVFKSEQKRIKEFKALTPENKKTLSKEYVKGGDKYILNPWVTQYEAEGGNLTSSEDVKKTIAKYYNNIISNKISTWKEAGVISTNDKGETVTLFDKTYFENIKKNKVGSKSDINAAIAYAAIDYEVNTIIGNLNLFQLFAGDPASYWKNSVKDTLVNVGKRLAAQIAPGDSLANTRLTDVAGINGHSYTQVIAKDHKMISSSIKYLTRLLDSKEVTDKEIENYKAGNTEEVEKKYPNAASYFDIEATDAQEYTTALEHAYNLYHEGKLSDKVYKELADKLINDRELSDADVKVLMQPMKPVYFNGDVKSAGTGSLNYYDMSYIKTSSFPLLKEFTVGTELDNLRKQLEKLQDPTGSKDPSQIKLVRMVMSSGIKIGSVQNPVTVFNPDGTVNSDIDFTESTKSLTRDGYRIQLEVPLKDKKEVNRGTQEIKLLFTDLLDHAFANGKTGKQLKTQYLDLNRQLFAAQLEIFKNQINANEKGDFDITLLRDKLVEEAQARNFSLNEIEALRLVDLDSEGKFVIPLAFNSASSKFESLMISLVDNSVRKQKQTGYSSPLGSSSGFKYQNDLKGIDKSKIIWVGDFDPSGDLKQQQIVNGKVKGSQVFVPWKFRDNNGKLLNIQDFTKKLEDGRTVIDHDKLPKELLKSFGFRIPTQGLNSMSYIEIAGFLPEETGDLLIAPAEFTKQMGSDFDIDKLYSYLYSTEFNYKTGKLSKFVFNNKDIFEILSSTSSNLISLDTKDYRLKTLIKEFGYIKVVKPLFQFYNDKIDGLKKELDNKWSLHETFVSNVLDTINVKEASLDTNKALINKAFRENEIYVAFLRDELSELRSIISALEKNELEEGINEYLVDKFDIYIDDVRTESIDELLRKEFELKNRLEKSVTIKESLKKFNASISDTIEVALDIKNDIFETKKDLRNILKYTSTLQNEILDIHLTVLSDPSNLVQSKVVSALGFGKLGDLKKDYDKETDSQETNLSPLSSAYQGQKYLSARGGKAGTGYFSSLNVFVSVMQGLGLKYNVSTPVGDGKFAMVEQNLVINAKGNGLSKNVDNKNELKSENAVAFQSAAVDDEKEQIMASLNITAETFYAIGAWVLDGHSQEAIVSILKQPIVAEYINAINNKTDIFSGYTKNADMIVFGELYDKYSKMTGLSQEILDETDFNNTVLSEDTLWNSFKATNKDANWAMTQLTALYKFRQADSMGKSIQKTISAFSVDSKGLGKSFIEVGLKLDDIKTERESGKITNIEKLYNESIGGLAVQYSLETVSQLFSKFYPYLLPESYNKVTFDEYLQVTFKDNLTVEQREKEFRDFYNHMKAGVYAHMLKNSGIDLYARRKELMYGENSVGKRIQELQKTTKNPFLIKLNPYVATIVGDPDTVSMRSIGGELFTEDDLYVGFLDLFNKPETRQLAKDLIDYFYINGGSQKAREYAKFIPTGFMVASGYADTLRSVNLFNFQPILGTTEEFLQDYIRNNPGKAPQLNNGDYNIDADGRVTVTNDQFTYVPKNGDGISMPIPYVTIAEKKDNKTVSKLYMYHSGSYVEIPRLGFTTSNYSGTEYGSKYSAIDSNAVKQKVQNPNTVQEPVRQEASTEPIIPNTTKVTSNDFEALNLNKVNSKEDIKITLSIINNSTSRALLDLLNKTGDLTLELTAGNSSYKASENKITIDSRIKDSFVLQTKVLHEVTHAVTSNIINKILSNNRIYTPENIQSLNPNQVFVFGSNGEGVHGKGAALLAKQKFGAVQGQSEGLQGQSYAVVTKKDWRKEKSSTLEEIGKSLQNMLLFAKQNPDKEFLVTKLGSSLAGYTIEEIKSLFEKLKNIIPNNVILPQEYEVRELKNPNFEGLTESQKLAYIRLNKTFTTLRQSVIDGKVPGLNKEGLAIFEAKIAALKAGQPGVDFTPDDIEYNAYSNLKEFLAEAFSNTTFQKQLDAMKFSDDRSMLQKLLEDIANFLNKFVADYNKDNVLAAVLYDGFTLAGGNEVNIYFKSGENAILSNLAVRPFQSKDGREYASVEHAYQSWKSGSFDEANYTSPNWIFNGGTNYKVAGNKGTKTENNWNLDLMKGLIRQSLDQNPDAKQALLNTGDKILTHNQDNTIWKNAFPQILMELRKEYYDAGLSGVNNPSDYVNHSGGAVGSDESWDIIGRQFGVTQHKHYREPGALKLDSAELDSRGIKPVNVSEALYNEGIQKSTRAAQQMYGLKGQIKMNYIIRNWAQVKNADSIYAIGVILKPGDRLNTKDDRKALVPQVKGGTGYAVQMAINEGKPVYVYDGTKNGWFKYDYNIKDFVPTSIPTLTKNFAGIGSRKSQDWNKDLQAIRDVYANTFKVQQDTSTNTGGNPKGEKIADGIYVNQQGLSSQEELELFELVRPVLEQQAVKSNKGKSAPKMAGLQLNWDYVSNRRGVQDRVDVGESLKPNNTYGWFTQSADGQKLYPITGRIVELMSKATGIDVTNYDGAIINIYNENSFIGNHPDIDESKTAEKYPVVVVNIGGPGNIVLGNKKVGLNSGAGYVFGFEGKNRTIPHSTYAAPIKGTLPSITTSMDGETLAAGSYRVSITMRRVMPLEQGMPSKPNTVNTISKTQPVETSTEEIQENLAEPTPQPEKSTFTYQNKTIKTDFKLTQGQTKAIEKLVDFAQSNTKTITLQGAAGTGKTSVIGYLQKYLGDRYNFVYMAPTHAATAELATATVKSGNRDLPMTVQSAFNKRKNPDTGQWEYGPTKKLNNKLEYSDNIIVLDEVSMLSDQDYDVIKDAIKNKQIQVIFMGDILQIPSVDTTNPEKKNVSKAFSDNEQILLTEVKRTNDNDILTILTELRTNPISLIPVIPNTNKLQYLDQGEFDNQIVETIRKEPEETVLLSYTNNGVKDSNRKLRKALGRFGNLQKNDIIVGFSGYKSKQIEKGNIANSVRYTVENVEKDGSDYIITAKSQKLKALEKLGVKNVHEYAIGVFKQLSVNDSFVFEDLTNEDFEKNNKDISEILKTVYDAKQAAISKRVRWNVYDAALGKASAYFENINLGNDYVYNPSTNRMELYNYIIHGEILKNFSELKVEKGVDYGHAITIHKSQGSTIKNVFFDANTLPQGTSSKLMQNGNQISTEKHSLIYVALSRASNMLVINKSNNSNFYKLNLDPENTLDLSVSLPQDLGMDNLEFIKDLTKEERTEYRKLLNNDILKVKCNG